MAPNFSKNAILNGDLDFFCLACETYITSVAECEAHISEADHEKNFASTVYIEEFKGDCIRKVRNKYFCELCNKVLPVLARVRLHINEPAHIATKNIGWIKRVGNVIVAFDDVVINELAWHSLADNTCAICNVEYEDVDVHKNLSSHLLNLLQLKIEFDKNKNIYRKIDETSFHCVICNVVQPLSNITGHFESITHKHLFQLNHEYSTSFDLKVEKSNMLNPNINGNGTKPKNNNVNNSVKQIDLNTSALKNQAAAKNEVVDSQAKGTSSKATSAKSKESKKKTEDSFTYEFDDKWEERICKVLKSKDYIAFNEDNVPWCILCDWIVDTSTIRQHLHSKHHCTMLKLHKNRQAKLPQKYLYNNNKECKENATDDNANVLDSLDEFKKDGIIIQFNPKLAFCNKCSLPLDNNYDTIKNHIIEHNKLYSKQNHDNVKETKSMDLQFRADTDVKKKGTTLFTSPVMLKRDAKVKNTTKRNDSIATKKERDDPVATEKKRDDPVATEKERDDSVATEKERDDSVATEEELNDPVATEEEINDPVATDEEINDHVEIEDEINDSATTEEEISDTQSNITVDLQDLEDELHAEEDPFCKTPLSQRMRTGFESFVEKVPSGMFISNIMAIKNVVFNDFVINNTFCVNQFSFLFTSFFENVATIKCYICDQTIFSEDYNRHFDALSHEIVVTWAPVLTQFKTEFIRELRPGTFHCGFCNVYKTSLDHLKVHLSTVDHLQCKNDCQWRLERYQASVASVNYETSYSEGLCTNMLRRNLF